MKRAQSYDKFVWTKLIDLQFKKHNTIIFFRHAELIPQIVQYDKAVKIGSMWFMLP